jgi:hypothetical protein
MSVSSTCRPPVVFRSSTTDSLDRLSQMNQLDMPSPAALS